jgi:hypothetical protein
MLHRLTSYGLAREWTVPGVAGAVLLGEPLDALLFTCAGVPGYRSAAAGPPGARSRLRLVTPPSQDSFLRVSCESSCAQNG